MEAKYAITVVVLTACIACAAGAETESTATRPFTVTSPATPGAGVSGVGGTSGSAGITSPAGGRGGSAALPAAGSGATPPMQSPPVAPSSIAGSAAPTPQQPTAGMAAPMQPVPGTPGQTVPAVTDYTRPGPFGNMTVNNTGPDGMYTMFRPATLGENGFKHPLITWGNGITTTPATYPWLGTVASHGFVIIASNSTAVTAQMMTAGLDWLIQQNTAAGPFQGQLDTERAVAMGYSLGGGASLSVAAHPSVVATISMHPAPGAGAGAHGPVLLFAGTADTVCAPALVQVGYSSVRAPAFYTELTGATHLEPVLTGGQELGPSIAWLRLWVYGDENARSFFFGADCTLCKSPWTNTMTNAAWQ